MKLMDFKKIIFLFSICTLFILAEEIITLGKEQILLQSWVHMEEQRHNTSGELTYTYSKGIKNADSLHINNDWYFAG